MRHALLQVVWTEMHVGSVCTQPPYNDKDPPRGFTFILFIISPFSYQADLRCLYVWRHTDPCHSHDCWLTLAFYLRLRPEWTVISPPLFQHRSRSRQEWLLSDWGVLLLDVIINIAVIIYSRHLSRWRRSGLPLFLKGIRLPIYLNAFIFTWIIRDSPTEEVRIRLFYASLQIAFPNTLLVSKFHG